MKNIKYHLSLLSLAVICFACSYQEIEDAAYPDQKIYLPAATVTTGSYIIDNVPTFGATRFYTDNGNTKFIIPLSIYRSGVTSDGDVNVTIVARPDTVQSLIAAGLLTADLLPDQVSLLPQSVQVKSGQSTGNFELSVDLSYLLANPTKRFAYAFGILEANRPVSAGLKRAVIVIDNKLFVPSANFSFAKSTTDPLSYTFTNSSVNGVTQTWDFGGAGSSSDRSPVFVFPAPGTYAVKLKTFGVAGAFSSEKITSIVVQ